MSYNLCTQPRLVSDQTQDNVTTAGWTLRAAGGGEQKNPLQRSHGGETQHCARFSEHFWLVYQPRTDSNPLFFLQTVTPGSRCPPLLLHRNRCAPHFSPLFSPPSLPLSSKPMKKKNQKKNKKQKSPLVTFYPHVLPCRHFPARRLPVFVPEEAAPRWLPPTPSSYCSGLLEWGRIRHSLTIALLNANHATDGHRKGRETSFDRLEELWKKEGDEEGTERERERERGRQVSAVKSPQPSVRAAAGGGGQSCRRGPTDA